MAPLWTLLPLSPEASAGNSGGASEGKDKKRLIL
jgi:hypothetical protein